MNCYIFIMVLPLGIWFWLQIGRKKKNNLSINIDICVIFIQAHHHWCSLLYNYLWIFWGCQRVVPDRNNVMSHDFVFHHHHDCDDDCDCHHDCDDDCDSDDWYDDRDDDEGNSHYDDTVSWRLWDAEWKSGLRKNWTIVLKESLKKKTRILWLRYPVPPTPPKPRKNHYTV